MSRGADLRVAVAGATGRTAGQTVAGVETEAPADMADALSSFEADVLVDFSVPEGSVLAVPAAGEAGVPAVVGTTGFDEEGLAVLHNTAEHVPVLKASNFARGVQALLRAVRAAVGVAPDYDVEVTETHHAGKRDAPSGTAKTLLSAIEEERAARRADELGDVADTDAAGEPAEHVYGREGVHPRDPGEIGVHVRRAGTVRGEHEVLLADDDEVVTLTHRAESRAVFAAGALDAAEWVVDREPGWYSFADVVDAGSGGGSGDGGPAGARSAGEAPAGADPADADERPPGGDRA